MRLFLVTTAFLAFCSTLAAQDYEPTSTWPYVCAEFTEGRFTDADGSVREMPFNVHIPTGHLHFIAGGVIREMPSSPGCPVEIGDDTYVASGGRMMKVLASSENGLVVRDTEVDMARLCATEGAYGSSSNSSATTALSSVVMDARVNVSHMELKNSKNDGQVLPLTMKMYIVVGGRAVAASKKDVQDLPGISGREFGSFCKQNRIRWRNPESLLKIIDYIAKETKK